ncbi:MAG: VOC family protein [Betaproteobacteria bacterium]|jgi:lactoylglutathione lyase|nr:VOC family protein [Betaproteobacteria bacterium]
MQFGYTILYVDNVPQTLAFFEKAFGLKTRFLHEGGDYGELETGTTALAFAARKFMASIGKNPQTPDAKSPVFEIALCTADVDSAVAQALKSGATLVQAPKEMPWGQTVAYVSDPDGFLIEVCTPMA